VILVETELWPNLIMTCREMHIPSLIVSGRVYPRDVGRYHLAGRAFRRVMSLVEWVGVQNKEERERFLRLGAAPSRVHVAGNLKIDLAAGNRPEFTCQATLSGKHPLIVAASTHQPEERWIIEAFSQIKRAIPDVRLVIAPRKVKRARALVRLVRRFQMKAKCYSAAGPPGSWDVLVIDRLGVLATCYAAGDVVVIGGTFVDHGGHNFLEAIVHKRAVVAGPSIHNFEDLFRLFQRENAIIRLETHATLTGSLLHLLQNPGEREQLGSRAYHVWESQRGVAREYAEAVIGLLRLDAPNETPHSVDNRRSRDILKEVDVTA
jgi:3-deoxy-D-manno-octulosonic-acid transferase